MTDLNPISAVEDYSEVLRDLNLSQFSDSENINNLLGIFADIFEESEQEWQELAEGFLLQSAVGEQLNTLGEEIGVSRPSEIDEEYRARILLISAARYYGITRDDLVELIKIVSGDINPQIYKGLGRFFEIAIQSSCVDERQLGDDLSKYFPIGTELILLMKEGTPFGFDGDDTTLGFGTTTGTTLDAGGLSSVIYPL